MHIEKKNRKFSVTYCSVVYIMVYNIDVDKTPNTKITKDTYLFEIFFLYFQLIYGADGSLIRGESRRGRGKGRGGGVSRGVSVLFI